MTKVSIFHEWKSSCIA